MNSFEQYTLIIGLLAICIEAFRHLKEGVRHWLHPQHQNKRD
jgi:hypothetical protein